ncbi:hypothetical protein CJF47_01260 [Aeromonas sobria]|nr:hypothetical protein CJF47_01260 [Aeromonas sobria]
MTIINANHYLEQLLAPAVLERIAQLCKFCLRVRKEEGSLPAVARHWSSRLGQCPSVGCTRQGAIEQQVSQGAH